MTVVDERAELLAGIAGQTLTSWLSRNAEEHPGSPALTWRDGESWRTLSWGGYRDRVEEVGAALVATGVEHGSRIAIMAGNRIEHVICDLAAVGVGAVPVSVYPTMSVEQVAYVAADAGVTLAVLADDVI
ncbi:MAG TPA: AMP-binding protein, partial [Mycobacteriales bacterium]|nr:AMP-binding protein [Mycobacteriales bacterium]